MSRLRQLTLAVLLATTIGAQPKPPEPQEPQDAQTVRDRMQAIFERYPPGLRAVLSSDPSLLANQAYMAPYPALQSFVASHPEVARNPGFYIGSGFQERRSRPVGELFEEVMAGLAVLTGMSIVASFLIWVIRTLIDYRRWIRLSKVQTDAHTKLLDRFTSNDELLGYVKSPAGAKFLESAPISLDAGTRPVGAPLSRVLWSTQVGIALLALGIGLRIVSGYDVGDAQQPLRAVGVIVLCLGAGFLVSALISYQISSRLGLIESKRAESPKSDAA